MKTIKAFWCQSPTQDFCNFGDTLTSYILRPYNINAVYEQNHPQIIGVGSLIHILPSDTDAYLFATGLMYPTKEFYFKRDPIGLRGKLSLHQFK